MMLALEMFRSCRAPWPARRSAAGCPASCPASPRRCGWSPSTRRACDRPGWARLRTRLSGICGSDLGALSGKTSLYFSARRLAAVRARPRGGRRAARGLRGPARRHPRRPRPGADLRGPRRRAVRELRGRADQPLRADHRRPPRRPACRPASARTPAAAGASSSPRTAASCTRARGLLRRAGDPRSSRSRARCTPRCAPACRSGDRVLVSGAGSVGLFATLALRELTDAGEIIVVAKHAPPARAGPRVRRDRGGRARRGAAAGTPRRPAPSSSSRSSPRRTCSAASTSPSTRSAASSRWRPRCSATRAGGRVVLSGMPAAADLSAAWFRELEVVGTYASAQLRRRVRRTRPSWSPPTPSRQLAKSVASYPLHRWREALDHAHSAGRLGTVKVAFDPRASSRSPHESPRIRSRGRRPDPAADRARGARLPAGGASRSAPASSTRRSRSPPCPTSTRRSATRCCTRSTPTRCPSCCSPGCG